MLDKYLNTNKTQHHAFFSIKSQTQNLRLVIGYRNTRI